LPSCPTIYEALLAPRKRGKRGKNVQRPVERKKEGVGAFPLPQRVKAPPAREKRNEKEERKGKKSSRPLFPVTKKVWKRGRKIIKVTPNESGGSAWRPLSRERVGESTVISGNTPEGGGGLNCVKSGWGASVLGR